MALKRAVYATAKTLGILALCRVLTRSSIRILAYHGASLHDEGKYNPLLFISPETFRRRIEWLLAKSFSIISLDEAVAALEGASDKRRLRTVLTFDDGWYSTASQLIPILAENGLRSALYLHTGHVEEDWPVLPVVLGYMVWKQGSTAVEIDSLGTPIDGTYLLQHPAERERFINQSCVWLLGAPATRQSVTSGLQRLARAMGLQPDDLALQSRRFDYVTHDELLEIAGRGCAIELHGHQHHYPAGDPDAFAVDLERCRDAIVGLGLPVPRHYCYPSGSFDAAAQKILFRIGVHSATTCIPGLVRPIHDARKRHYLPRFLDGDSIDMLVFEAEMSGFAELMRRLAGRSTVR